MLMPVLFAEQIVNDSSFTVRTMGWFVLATVPITIAIAVLSIREGEAPSQVHEAKLRDYLGLFSLRSTRLLLAVQLLIGLALGISAAVFLFFFTMLKAVPLEYVGLQRSEAHTSELQSLMRSSYADFCLKKKKNN